MIRVGLLRQLNTLANEDFRAHWRGTHSEIASQIPGIITYRQNHIMRAVKPAMQVKSIEPVIHGISQIWFSDGESMEKGFSSQIIKELHEDEERFIEKLNVVSVKQYSLGPVEIKTSLAKVMIVIKAANNEENDTHVIDEIGEYFNSLPTVKGCYYYKIEDNVRTQDSKLQIDGIIELWFEDEASVDVVFTSASDENLLDTLSIRIEQMSIFLVETYIIVQ